VSTSDLAVDLLAKLVAFDTTSRNCNLELIDFVAGYLAADGVRSARHDYVAGCKTNLHASIGPEADPAVVLSGHTDVVPVDGQPWTSDPFRLTTRGTRLIARGSCDMKGFIAVALAMVPEFRARRLRNPIQFAFSCDEEVGCRGVVPLVQSLAAHRPPPALVIVGEPSSMRVLDAHKGNLTFVTEVTGAEAHSGNPARGVNAITYAARLVGEMEREAAELRGLIDPSGRFEPPYSTLHVGLIAGGTAKNIVPGHCTITWELRPLPGADPGRVLARLAAASRALEAQMRTIAPRAAIETRQLNAVPPLEADRRELRDRGGPFSGRRHAGGDLRSGQHRPGAPGRRVRRAQRTRRLHRIHAPPRRRLRGRRRALTRRRVSAAARSRRSGTPASRA
jgi:acetylornithine deacetylase